MAFNSTPAPTRLGVKLSELPVKATAVLRQAWMQELYFHSLRVWHGGCTYSKQTKWRAEGTLSRKIFSQKFF
jgi:hypothetical protein